MAWSLSSVGNWASGHSYSAHNFDVTAPSGSGGILLLHLFVRESTPVITVGTGWTLIHQYTNDYYVRLYARISDGGANDSPNVAFDATTVACAQISRWTGGNTTLGSLLNASNVFSFASEITPNGNIALPSVTPTVNNCLVLRMGYTRNDDGAWTTPPSGDTLGSQVNIDLAVDMSAAWVYRIQTTATAVSAGDITGPAESSNGYSIAVALIEEDSIKYLKLLAHSSAQSATGVNGVVFAAPTGGAITGTEIGEFTGKTFEATLESGKAVLKVPVADFGGGALTTSDSPVALVRNTTKTTGIISCTVIEE